MPNKYVYSGALDTVNYENIYRERVISSARFCSLTGTGAMQAIDKKTLVDAYRNLFKSGLRAVAFSVPARYVVRGQLRKAFRDGSPSDYNQMRIANTVEFFNQASKAAWIEHKILKNLIHVHYYERENTLSAKIEQRSGKIPWHSQETKDGYRSYYNALKVFNDNHRLCLI